MKLKCRCNYIHVHVQLIVHMCISMYPSFSSLIFDDVVSLFTSGTSKDEE